MNDEARARDLLVTLAALVTLLWWEASGWDLVVAGWYGDARGFALRDAWLTRTVLHDGARVLSGLALAWVAVLAWRGDGSTMARPQRLAWLGAVLAALIAVPALKRLSLTSCPSELDPFGGRFDYVPHWLLTVADGGPGHCFPSGHAVAAFAFLPLYFQWRDERPRLALAVLATVLGLGALLGWAQLARGAHFPSHTLWSAWLCWTIGALAARWMHTHSAAADHRRGDRFDGVLRTAATADDCAACSTSQASSARTAGRARAAGSTTRM
jgi:membrane-associated PAP2 superfamily phosphatase